MPEDPAQANRPGPLRLLGILLYDSLLLLSALMELLVSEKAVLFSAYMVKARKPELLWVDILQNSLLVAMHSI